MQKSYDFLGQLAEAMEKLEMTPDVSLEIAIGGSQVYEIEGDDTRWKPVKGTRKYNKDAFIVISRVTPVVSSVAPKDPADVFHYNGGNYYETSGK